MLPVVLVDAVVVAVWTVLVTVDTACCTPPVDAA
jgi:hypothetical protein